MAEVHSQASIHSARRSGNKVVGQGVSWSVMVSGWTRGDTLHAPLIPVCWLLSLSLTRSDSRKGELSWLKFEGIQSIVAGKAWQQYTAPWQWEYETACSHLRSGSRDRTLILSILMPFYFQSSSRDCAKQEGWGKAEPGDGNCPSVWHDLSFEGCVGALQERCYSEYCTLSAFLATARMWCSNRQWPRGKECQNGHSQHTFL